MKKYLQNSICLCHLVLSGQSTTEVVVVSGPSAIIGFVGMLAPLNR